MTYKIYHIPGIKIGCSKNPKKRIQNQGYSNYEILEEHSDIYVASQREIELQEQYGYGTDNNAPYHTIIKRCTPENQSKATLASLTSHKDARKFTYKDAEIIRKRYANEKITQRQLAKEYKVAQRTISNILQNKTYNYDL